METKLPSDTIELHHTIGLEPWRRYTIKQLFQVLEVWCFCDDEDKSTEFMLQFMSDVSGVDFDDVVDYIGPKRSSSDRNKYYSIPFEQREIYSFQTTNTHKNGK